MSVALPEADERWQGFLKSLAARGLRTLESMTANYRTGSRAMQGAVSRNSARHRREFLSARNTVRRVPNLGIGKRTGGELHAAWNAGTLARAEVALVSRGASDHGSATKLAKWLEEYVLENLAVLIFTKLPRRRLRTSSPTEFVSRHALKCRTAQVRAFLSEGSLMPLVKAILVEKKSDGTQTARPTLSGDARMRDLLSARFQTSNYSIWQK